MVLNTEPSIEIVGEAEGGQDAIERACCLQPDVILMDLVMPQGDGIQAIAELKPCLPEAKIIVLTTFNKVGFLWRITKPFSLSNLSYLAEKL
jgi:two-component system, NarL family, response regulator LiaR